MLSWLQHLVAPLNSVVFVLGNDNVSWQKASASSRVPLACGSR
jgi:hypothetical protein